MGSPVHGGAVHSDEEEEEGEEEDGFDDIKQAKRSVIDVRSVIVNVFGEAL